ncbi:MAG: prephenate dehydratase [Halothiobacillaceae bacterium]|nr:prephenate dehydratase [Halothiobacillaceae bacterium]HER34680.1 prephenate dehydratase [Halothiobacillaceae bacterium]
MGGTDANAAKAARPESLDEVRGLIDGVDRQILDLLSERARLAEQVAAIKQRDPDHHPAQSFYRPEREAQVLARIRELNPGPLDDDTVAWLFREIMSACLAHERPLAIATLGPAGTFSELAAATAFGHGGRLQFEPGIPEVFRAVAAGSVDYGVVPMENSTEGSVSVTLDSLAGSDLLLCGEVALRIDQQLMVHPEAASTPRVIVSHAQSLAQCREWLDAHYPGVERLAVASNSTAAQQASQDVEVFAVGPAVAAERHGLVIRASNIQDNVQNTTRFAVLGREPVAPSGDDKTALLLSVTNEPGALSRLLAPLSEAGIDVMRIESRPARDRVWDYVFFIDIAGHRDEPRISEALERLRPHCGQLRVLGSYPVPAIGLPGGER